jgi:phage terminase large subunit
MRENGLEPARVQIWLPHDGETHDRVYDVSYESAFKKAGYKVEVIPNQGKGAAKKRIEIVRNTFPSVWFNAAETEAGRESLGFYHEKRDDERDIGLGPEHDWSSHAADAFGLGCIAFEKIQKESPAFAKPIQYSNRGIV